MVSKNVRVINPTGLHLNPANMLCAAAMNYSCSVSFVTSKDPLERTNVKSVLSVLGAGVKCGDEIELICEGEDEEQALEELSALIESGLGQ